MANTHERLTIGTRVSYSDMANPHSVAVVVGDAPDGQSQTYSLSQGMKLNQSSVPVVFLESYSKSTVSMTAIEGPGGWQLEDGIETAETVAELITKSDEKLNAVRANREAQSELRAQRIEIGKALYEELAPAGTKAVIMAEHEVDDCDSMSDYFNVKTTKRVVLGYSKHTRRLFSEMRKVAAASSMAETLSGIIESGKDAEHREDYSMGHGLYLKAGRTYGTGWTVRKSSGKYGIDNDVYLALAAAHATQATSA